MSKLNWKIHLKNRFKIAGFIFALVGWFMLIVVPLEQIFNKDMSGLEEFVETGVFKWGIKIFVIILLILFIKGQDWIYKLIDKHKWLKVILKIIFIGGAIGWFIGLLSLLIQ